MTPKAGPLNLSSTVSACFHFAKHTECFIRIESWEHRYNMQVMRFSIQFGVNFRCERSWKKSREGEGQKWWRSDNDSLPQQLEGRRCCQNHRHQWLCAWQSKRTRRPHPFYMLAKLCHNILLRNDPKKHKTDDKNPKGSRKFNHHHRQEMLYRQHKIASCAGKYVQVTWRY
jgi:hypothetical protein